MNNQLVEAYSMELEPLLCKYKIWLTCYGFKISGYNDFGHPVYEYVDQWWEARLGRQLSQIGNGPTPREAIIDLFKKQK